MRWNRASEIAAALVSKALPVLATGLSHSPLSHAVLSGRHSDQTVAVRWRRSPSPNHRPRTGKTNPAMKRRGISSWRSCHGQDNAVQRSGGIYTGSINTTPGLKCKAKSSGPSRSWASGRFILVLIGPDAVIQDMTGWSKIGKPP
jgi:hypothetical protein